MIPPSPSDGAEPAAPAADAPSKARRRSRARKAAAASTAPRVDPPAPETQPAIGSAAVSRGSVAALVALLLFAWGESLLVFEWARLRWFEPVGVSPLALTFPFFIGAIVAALAAIRSRLGGRSVVGGQPIHVLGLASGMLAAVALALALWLGPQLMRAQEDVRILRAVRQVEEVASGLAAHHAAARRYPDGASVREVLPVLAPRLDRQDLRSTDPWGHELEYRSLSEGRGYLLVSSGPDGNLDLPLVDYVKVPRGALGGDDIIVMNGTFVSTGLGGLFDSPRSEPMPAAPTAAP